MRRRAALGAAMLVAVLAGVIGTLAFGGNRSAPATSAPPPMSTAVITRTTLSTSTFLSGTLGYSGSFTVTVPGGTAASALTSAEQQAATALQKVRLDERQLSRATALAATDPTVAAARQQVASAESTLATAKEQLAADRRIGCPDVSAGSSARGAPAGGGSSSSGPSGDSGSGGAPTGSGGASTPAADPPSVSLAPARAVTGAAAPGSTTAELSGTVLGGGLVTRYVFEYGASSALGDSTASAALPARTSAASTGAATAVSVLVSGLHPGTSYVYRLVVANALGSWRGDEATFTTMMSACAGDAAAVAAGEQALSTAQITLADDRASAQSQSTADQGQLESDALAARQAQAGVAEARAGAANSATTLTALAQPDTTIRRGGTVYALDGVPVPLFYGNVVPSRALFSGVSDGPDVAQLQDNLIALGFGRGLTATGHLDAATASALAAYQRSIGADPSGMLRLGDVVVAPGPLRVSSLDAVAGQTVQSGMSLLQATSTRRIVSVALNPNNAPVVSVGEPVSIVLPSNASVPGTIISIGPPAPGSGSSAPPGESVLAVVPRAVAATGRAAGVPVEVSVTIQIVRNVLAMPIAALLALAGGGYGVEVVLPSGRQRLVAVQTGLYSNTAVQVSGNGISAGTRVVVAQ